MDLERFLTANCTAIIYSDFLKMAYKNDKNGDESEMKCIVIAMQDPEKALYTIAKDAMVYDEMEIHFTEKYAPTVEYLLRILRKAFGWMEADRGTKEVFNTKCVFDNNGYCSGPCAVKGERLKCIEMVKLNCKNYKRKFERPFVVNYVVIEKVGQIRNM